MAPPLAVEISEAQLWTAAVAIVGSLASVVVWGVKGWMRERDDRLSEMKTQRDDYKRIAVSTVEVAEQVVLRQLAKRGIPAADALIPVKPEHNSPTTEKQKEQAEFATIQARRAAVDVALEKLLEAEEASVNKLPVEPPKPIKVEIVPAAVPLPVEVVAAEPVPVEVVKKPDHE